MDFNNMTLEQKSCVPCRGGIPPMPQEEAQKMLLDVPRWKMSADGIAIERNYAFDNFVDALSFANKVGDLAEHEGHHPDLELGWGYCKVRFYSHKIGGLHENDFIMASKTETLYQP